MGLIFIWWFKGCDSELLLWLLICGVIWRHLFVNIFL
jgi:hypothetical protein